MLSIACPLARSMVAAWVAGKNALLKFSQPPFGDPVIVEQHVVG